MYLLSIVVCNIILFTIVTANDFFMAMSKMENLLTVEEILINHLRFYVSTRRSKLESWNR